MSNLTPRVLHPNIYVYENAFKDSLNFIEDISATPERWLDWYSFGKITHMHPANRQRFSTFPSPSEWDTTHQTETTEIDANLSKKLDDIFYLVTSDYVSKTGTELPNWVVGPRSVCLYNSDYESAKDLVMHYHTDYQQEKSDEPGDKFGVTCTMYLNDDYVGGDLVFKIYSDDGETFERVSYKPKQGDIIVFPSGEPFYHGVKKIASGKKYFIRSFWCYYFEGTDEWLANQEKYGAEEWAKMERERHVAAYRSELHTRND